MINDLGLGDVCGAVIERIKAQTGDYPKLGVATVMWISHAKWQLQADELCPALAVKLSSADINTGNIPSISTLVSCCQGLSTVDKEALNVHLIHFTLQEYLSARSNIFSRPQAAIAEICFTYLNSRRIKALSTDPSPDIQNAPFLEYSVYWGVYAKRELSDCARSLALELLKDDYGQISTELLLAQVKHFFLWGFKPLSLFSGLHCASFFRIAEAVAGLIEMGCYDINEEDFSGCGPLA